MCVDKDRKTNLISGILRMTGFKSLEGVAIHQLVFNPLMEMGLAITRCIWVEEGGPSVRIP